MVKASAKAPKASPKKAKAPDKKKTELKKKTDDKKKTAPKKNAVNKQKTGSKKKALRRRNPNRGRRPNPFRNANPRRKPRPPGRTEMWRAILRSIDRGQARAGPRAAAGGVARRSGRAPRVETLEQRQLLSFLNPFGSKFERVQSGGVVDVISVSGPGQVFTKRLGRKMIGISLVGTTQDSQVAIAALAAQPGTANSPLQVGRIKVATGRLGSFQALTTVDLQGRVTPLTGPVSSLQFDAIGPAAQININGDLGQLSVNRNVTLGKTGQIEVSNDLTGSFSVTGDVVLDGGRFGIGRDLSGTFSIGGSLMASDGGQFLVGRNLGSTASMAAPVSIGGNLTASSGGALAVGGNVSELSVSGNIETSTDGQIAVGGALGDLTVSGVIQGSGSNDLVVHGNLGQLTVFGGGPNGYSLQQVGITVSKSIQGLDVRNGIANSVITAGILINGGMPGTGSNGWNIGPNGTIAVLDSQITAATPAMNITLGGAVVDSNFPISPSSGQTT